MGENTRTALIGIIVEDAGSVEELNQLLHQYRDYIIGRMGIPHPQKSISIISIAMEADLESWAHSKESAQKRFIRRIKEYKKAAACGGFFLWKRRVREVVCLATL